MIEVAVTVNLECAHRDSLGRTHGHSYLVEVWQEAGADLIALDTFVRGIAGSVDHSTLEDSVGGPRMEDIAGWFLERVPTALRVVIRRPTIGFACEARRETAADGRRQRG